MRRSRLLEVVSLRATIIHEYDNGGVMVEFVAPMDGETVDLSPVLLEHCEIKMPVFPPEEDPGGTGPFGY